MVFILIVTKSQHILSVARIRYFGALSQKKNIAADFQMGGGASLPKGVSFFYTISIIGQKEDVMLHGTKGGVRFDA